MRHIPLALLMDCDDMDDIVEAMAQGVRGFITTSMELTEIEAAIQCVAAGSSFVPADT
jgi:DNA-binding NarL/FixJ family response regulator